MTVAPVIRTVADLSEFADALRHGIGHYFGWEPSEAECEQYSRLLPLDRLHAAFDGDRVVAAAGALPFGFHVPGGTVPAAGVTVVGVLPTHRRQGLMTRLMDVQLRDARERGESLSVLWASEETIYGRFGYGLASLTYRMRARAQTAALGDVPGLEGARARLVEHEEACRELPLLYRAAAQDASGFIDRSPAWWEVRRLGDEEWQRRGAGPLNRLLVEHEGRAVGYALYRVHQERLGTEWRRTVRVLEAFGVSPAATFETWRVLLAIDWMDTIESWMLPLDHPLVLGLARVNDAELTVFDGIWVRVLDVGQALRARAYAGDGRVTIEVVSDPHFPDNAGTWTIDGGAVRRTRRRPDVRLPVASLGAAYLGGFSFAQLARVGRVEETTRGGLSRVDALFRTETAPWCPENF